MSNKQISKDNREYWQNKLSKNSEMKRKVSFNHYINLK